MGVFLWTLLVIAVGMILISVWWWGEVQAGQRDAEQAHQATQEPTTVPPVPRVAPQAVDPLGGRHRRSDNVIPGPRTEVFSATTILARLNAGEQPLDTVR